MGQKKANNSDPFVIKEQKVKNFLLSRDKKLDWVEETTCVDGESRARKDPKDFLGRSISNKKLNLFLVLIFLGLSILLFKTAYLQIIKGDYFREIAEENRLRLEIVKAERGIIYDRNLTPLVRNIPSFSLFAVSADLPKDEEERLKIITRLNEILEEDFNKIFDELLLNQPYSYQPVIIKENISYEKASLLVIESVGMPGVKLDIEGRREYLENNLEELQTLSMSHVLGYEGKITKEEFAKYGENNYSLNDYIGKTGLEASYEKKLKGQNGKKQIEVDARGKEKRIVARQNPVGGSDLILTIDLNLQRRLEEILDKNLKSYQKSKGAAILLNPQNGEILALVNLPTFDINVFAKGISESEYQSLINNPSNPFFGRAIQGAYPSGSTIKPIVASAALEEGLINASTSFLSTGGIWYDKWFFPDWKAGGHGPVNVTQAIAESVNTFFYIIGGGYKDFEGLGVEKIVEYAKLFGLGNYLGIDLPSEAPGLLPTPEWKEEEKDEPWYIGNTYHLAIGQGDVLVTPLQVALATAVFANGGVLYEPYVVKQILNSENEPITQSSKIIRKDFITEENINIVKKGLRQAVLYGSARRLQNLSVTSAGKTGTAEQSKDKPPHAWFTGFAPYENPEIAITVLVEEGGEGSGIALDIALEFLMWYFSE